MHTPTMIIAGAALLLTAQTPVPEPSEAMKRQALILGYTLNGNSMVRPLSQGSIDVSHLLAGKQPPTPAEIDFERSPTPPKKK